MKTSMFRRRGSFTLSALALAALVAGLFLGSSAAAALNPLNDAHHATTGPVCAAYLDVAGTPGGMMGGMDSMPGMMATPGAGMGMMGEVAFDLMFIDMMIPHHESAVVMAQIALERAEHQEIRDLAEAIIAAQTSEIEQMRAWREAWFPGAAMMGMDQMTGMMRDLAMGMPGMGMMNAEQMGHMLGMAMDAHAEGRGLCQAEGSFDLAFIDAMIPHHEGAVVMAKVALAHAERPEIKALAQAIIDAQEAEIAQMTEWRAAWSGGATPVAG